MLVLSRRQNQTLVFPSLSITLEILKLSNSQVRIGIDAPMSVEVRRGELLSDADEWKDKPSDFEADSKSFPSKVGKILASLQNLAIENQWYASAPAISELVRELAVLESESQAKQERAIRKRALLVEDNVNESRLLASYLRIKGIDVDVAHDGQAALNRMNQVPTDVVLLDMSMPQFDGLWTIERIRSNPELRSATVFAVSGMERESTGVDIGPNGVDEWFTKPLNPELLAQAINQHLVAMSV